MTLQWLQNNDRPPSFCSSEAVLGVYPILVCIAGSTCTCGGTGGPFSLHKRLHRKRNPKIMDVFFGGVCVCVIKIAALTSRAPLLLIDALMMPNCCLWAWKMSNIVPIKAGWASPCCDVSFSGPDLKTLDGGIFFDSENAGDLRPFFLSLIIFNLRTSEYPSDQPTFLPWGHGSTQQCRSCSSPGLRS